MYPSHVLELGKNCRRLALLILLFILPAAVLVAEKPPQGFDAMIVFAADGVLDPTSSHPNIPGCGSPRAGECDGDYFHRRYMNRTEAEIQEAAEAKAFFAERFGLDVDALAAEGRVEFRTFFLDPRVGYRVHHMTERNVPPRGYRIIDGAWTLEVFDPDGVELGGAFAGQIAPIGARFAYGDYFIQAPEPFTIHYRTIKPAVAEADGSVKFQCEIFTEQFGWGLAQGIADFAFTDDGRVKQNIRNVLTFPGLGRRGL